MVKTDKHEQPNAARRDHLAQQSKKSKGKDTGKKDRKKGEGDALLPTAANTPAGASPARSEEKVSAAGGDGEGWAEWRRAEAVQGRVLVWLGNVLRALGSCSPW